MSQSHTPSLKRREKLYTVPSELVEGIERIQAAIAEAGQIKPRASHVVVACLELGVGEMLRYLEGNTLTKAASPLGAALVERAVELGKEAKERQRGAKDAEPARATPTD